jgi:hypothetical protein
MKRLFSHVGIVAVCALAVLIAGSASARLLYQETVTIVLKDGTQVSLVLDDYGMTKPDTGAAKMQEAKFDFLNRVTAAGKGFQERWGQAQVSPIQGASAAQQQTVATISKLSGDLVTGLGQKRDHLQGKYLWPMKAGNEKHYYYLPPPPRVARDATGKPQFLFMKFTSDKDKAHGGVAGGILHFLAEYGLSPQQELELKQKLAQAIPGAKVMGAVSMEPGEGESTFRIISAILTDTGFTQKVVASGKAPLMPGQKVAAAARLDPAGAVLLEESLKKPTSDISVEFDLAYTSFLPAFDGTITFDWERFKAHVDDWKMRYRDKKECKWWIFGCKHTYTTDEMREIYDFMCQNETIKVEWTEGITDERLEAIRQAFFKFMETSFFERTASSFGEGAGEEDKKADEGMTTPEKRGSATDYNRYLAKSEQAFQNKKISMKVTLPVKLPYITVGNISGAWYRDAKQKNPELFSEVNVDDPFFQQRQVVFNLDLDAVEIFDQAINFVTVEVRKQRGSGRDFHDSFTINKQWLTEKGPSATITYAKMRDDSPEVFDYLVRWSLRRGVEWPASPTWIKGSWEGVTLAPPVIPLKIEAEADLEELKSLDFMRATVEVRYTQFGNLVADTRALQLSVAKGENLASMMIFRDPAQNTWEYRLNFYHKRFGRRQTEWRRGGDDGYVLASLPEGLREDAEAARPPG